MPTVTTHAPGTFCWPELATSDQDAAKKFYSTVFGWQFTDADMGNLISKPLIVRLPSGTWAALFSSGYESSRATPILYTVNLETGALIAKTDTGANKTGCDVTITAANYPYNGLGALRHYNTKSGTAAITYAGDLAGNLWRFATTSTQRLK